MVEKSNRQGVQAREQQDHPVSRSRLRSDIESLPLREQQRAIQPEVSCFARSAPTALQFSKDAAGSKPGASVSISPGEVESLKTISPMLASLGEKFVELKKRAGELEASPGVPDPATKAELAQNFEQCTAIAAQIDECLNAVTELPFFAQALAAAKAEANACIGSPVVAEAIFAAVHYFSKNAKQKPAAAVTREQIAAGIARAKAQVLAAGFDNSALCDVPSRTYGTYDAGVVALSSPGIFFRTADFEKTDVQGVIDGFVTDMADILVHEVVAHSIAEGALAGVEFNHEIMNLVINKLSGVALTMESARRAHPKGALNGTISRILLQAAD